MKLLDVLTSPWAIEPAKLLEIQGIYATHLRGDKIDLAGVEQRLGRPLANEPKAYEVLDGVAVLPIEGVIAKRANLFSQISGGVSTELIGRDIRAALNDPAVHSIILSIDSPGGTVDGTQALASIVTGAKSVKPVVALASGTMASAAYWIGSAAQAVYIADATTIVGSIGVVASHKDVSGAEKQAGIKTTEIYAGQYKRISSSYAPLTDAGRQSIQDQVDYTYSLFVADVAKQRGVSEKQVLKDMADGRVFQGQQAIDAGLVDGVSTLDALIAQLNTDRVSGQSTSAGAAHVNGMPQLSASKSGKQPDFKPGDRVKSLVGHMEGMEGMEGEVAQVQNGPYYAINFDKPMRGGKNPHKWLAQSEIAKTGGPKEKPKRMDVLNQKGYDMNAEELATAHPEAAAAIRAQGADAERARILAVEGQLIPGHEALINGMKFDGKSSAGDAAMAVNAAEKQSRNAAATALAKDAPAALPSAVPPAVTPTAANYGTAGSLDANTDVDALDAAAKTYQAAHPGTSYIAAVKAAQLGA